MKNRKWTRGIALSLCALQIVGAVGLTSLAAETEEAAETLYYYDDFESYDAGELPDGMRRIEGSNSSVVENSDGNKVLQMGTNSTGNRVLVEMPDGVGDYTIEADVTYISVAESTRWASIMYRIQNYSYPYYQMCVRQGATAYNGVEMAMRTVNDAWDVRNTASFTENMALNTTYHWKVEVHGDTVMEYINDQLLIYSEQVGEYAAGDIGLQTNNAVVQFDNLRVTALEEELENPQVDSAYAAAKTLSENLVNAPTVIADSVTGMADVQGLVDDQVTSTVYTRLVLEGDELAVYSGSAYVATLSEFLDLVYGQVLTIFEIEDTATADAFATFVGAYGYEDMHFATRDVELSRNLRQQATTTRASLIVDGEITEDNLYDIVEQVNTAWGKNIIIANDAADKPVIEKIQQQLITVYVTSDSDEVSLHTAITSGANGVITGDTQALLEAVSLYNDSTLTCRPFIIGHRGTPGSAPENTIASYYWSHTVYGSDMIETDVYLSADGYVVCMHDSTLARTTDITTTDKITDEEVAATGKSRSTLTVGDLTLEQLKRLDAGSWYGEEFAGEPIPTLSDIYDFMSLEENKDVVLFLELKNGTYELAEAAVDVILSYGEDIMNRTGIISFYADGIEAINEIYPGLSSGFLTYVSNTGDTGEAVGKVLNQIMPINATYNPSYTQYIDGDLMTNLNARGISVWPWTYRSDTDHKNHIAIGVSGLTTDYADWTQDSVLAIYAERTAETEVGETITLTADTTTNNGRDAELPLEVIVLEGEDVIAVDGDQVTGLAAGTAVVMLKARTPEQTGNYAYDLYTQPITITVQGGEEELVEVESVTIEANAMSTVSRGDTLELSATVTPDNATDKTVQWTSSAPAVATVDENGVVTAIKTGSTRITATAANGVLYMITVRVTA